MTNFPLKSVRYNRVSLTTEFVITEFHCISIFQLENADEQAAAIRRELDARQEKISEMERVRQKKITDLFKIPFFVFLVKR
jgi:hypothetical protein